MLFEEQVSRKPDKYPWTKDFIDAMWNGHWTPNEFSFQSDVHDFKVNLSDSERDIIVKTLSAIAQIEIAVKKFWSKLGDNLPHPSINDLGMVMANVEVIHNRAYEKLLDVLGIADVFEKNLDLDIIKGRVNYLRKYNHRYYESSKKQYIYSIILFTLYVENVSLFSQFYIINYFNRFKNVLKDTAHQTAYTAAEENLHAQAGIKIINTLKIEYPELFDAELESRIMEETMCAYEAECKIIDWIVEDYDEEFLNANLLKEFIKNRLNESIKGIGFKPILEVDNSALDKTIWFDEDVLGERNTDFFHIRPTAYTKADRPFSGDDLF